MSTARIWYYDFPNPDDDKYGWRILKEFFYQSRFGGNQAESYARQYYQQTLRWRVAYGELFAITVDNGNIVCRLPLPVNPRVLPY